MIEAGYNDISGAESGKVAAGDYVDIQIKDIGYVLAGATITKGQEVTAGANGLAAVAAAGNYVLGIALNSARRMNTAACRLQNTRRLPPVPDGI